MSQFIHVSEFFETTLCLAIPMLITAQILAFRYELWESVNAISQHEYQQNERWKQNEQIYRGSIESQPADDSIPPNSIDRNIKQQLINNPPHSQQIEAPQVIQTIQQKKPNSNPELNLHERQDDNQNRFIPQNNNVDQRRQSNQIQVVISNQPAPSNYPIEDKPYLKLYLETHIIFDEYIPVIMCCVVVAILVESTYILSMFCFFCYLFVNLIFNYAKLFEKLAAKTDNPLTPLIISNLAGLFLIAFFIGIFIRTQYKI